MVFLAFSIASLTLSIDGEFSSIFISFLIIWTCAASTSTATMLSRSLRWLSLDSFASFTFVFKLAIFAVCAACFDSISEESIKVPVLVSSAANLLFSS